MLRLAVPSDGALHEETLRLLTACGLDVHRSNQRRYTAEMPSLPGVTVHFQRSADIGLEVEEGTADLGVTGYDKYLETRREGGEAAVIIEGLDFGHSKLVLGVPDSWIDVESVSDLAELAMEFREEGRDLQVATKYPRSVERFLLRSGVNYFSLVPSSGTLEVAPAMGYADIIADITSSGTTLRENRLKTIQGGVIMSSEACLVANRRQVASSEEKLQLATALLERMEARLEGQGALQCDGQPARGDGRRRRQPGAGPRGHFGAPRSDYLQGAHAGRRRLVRRHRPGRTRQDDGSG